MRHVPAACSIILVLAAMPAGASTDGAYHNTPAIGGPGGGEFNGMCPGKSKMIGIGGRSGAWIDAVHPVCGVWNQQVRDFRRVGDGQHSGGNGGGPAEVRCPPRTAVGGWEIAQVHHNKSNLVQYVRLFCVASTSSAARPIVAARYGGAAPVDRANVFRYRCPPMMLAIGLYGRSGAFLDNAGLVCMKTGDLFALPGQ